jgi:hypothetical protein
MSRLGSYKNTAFSESQKFLVLDPSTSSASLVLASELVAYITPKIGSVLAETTRLSAENTDYKVGEMIQTSGATAIGDGLASIFLVVAGGDGDFPMINGNDLLVIFGDDALRAQLISEAFGEGASLVSMEGGPTVEIAVTAAEVAILNRVIRVSSRTEMKAYDVPAGYQFSLSEGGRSGSFVVKAGSPPSDPSEGINVVLTNGNYAMRRFDGISTNGGVDFYWFGALGDDVNDDVAVVAAWDYALAQNLAISFSDGTFKKSTTLTANVAITMRGQSKQRSIINHTGAGPNLVIDGLGSFIYNGTVSDFTLKGDSDKVAHTGTTGHGLVLNYVGNGWSFENLDVIQNDRGLSASNSFTAAFRNCRFQWNRSVGAYGFTEFNNPTFDSCQFNFNGTIGARLSCVQGSVVNCNAEGNEEEQIILLGRSWYIGGIYFEKPARGFAMLKLDGVQGFEVGGGCYFNDLGFTGASGNIIAIQVAGNSNHGLVSYGSFFRNTSTELIAVDVIAGLDNAFWLEADDVFQNASTTSNRRLDFLELAQEESGIASVADNGTIAHGLGIVPDKVQLTLFNASGLIVYWKARTTTTITVGMETLAGASVGSPRTVSYTIKR